MSSGFSKCENLIYRHFSIRSQGILSVYWPQSHRVTDTHGYSVYGWVKFFVPDFNNFPYSLRSQGDKLFCQSFRALPKTVLALLNPKAFLFVQWDFIEIGNYSNLWFSNENMSLFPNNCHLFCPPFILLYHFLPNFAHLTKKLVSLQICTTALMPKHSSFLCHSLDGNIL